MEAILDFLLMPLLGLVSAALCIGILFCLNHIANGGLRGNGGYAFEGLVNVPSSTLDTDAPRAELIRRRNMHKAKLQQQEDTGLFTPPFVPPAPYHPRRLSMMHIIKTPPSPSATFLPAISPSSPASSALAQLQRWPLVAMRRAEARDSMEFVTTTSPNIPVLMQGGGRNVHSQAPGRVPSPSLNPVRATARTFGQEPSLQAPHPNGAIPQPLPASEVPSPGVVADDNPPAAAALDQHQAGPPPAPPPPAPEARVEVSTENASLAELIAVMARSKKLVIDPVGTNGETRTPSRILLKRVPDQSPMARTPTTDPSSVKRRRAEGAEGAESEMEESQPRKRVHTPMPKDKAVPSSAQRKRKPEFISSATRSRTPSSSKKPASQKSEPEAKKSRGAQQKSSPPTAVREDGETPRRKKNILERVLAVYPPSLPPPVADTPGRYEESTVVMDAQQTPAMASTPMMPPLSMGPPPPVVAMTMSSPVSPSLLLEQLSPRGGASADRPLSPRGRAPLASSSQERKDMLNGRKRRTVSFDEQQLLQVVQQEDERKRKLMRELEQEELADKKANKRVGKLLQAATPKKRVQINMEASVIKFDSFAPPSDSAAAKGKPEEQQKPGDLPGSVTFDSSSTSLFASTNWEWDSPASSSEKKEPKPTKRREKRGRAGSDSSSPGSSALVSSADLPSDMPLPILFSSDTSSSSSSRSTAASAGGSSVASFFSGDAASPFDSFLSSASSASSSASANDPFFSPTPVAAARDSSATTTSSDALASLFGPGAISNTSAAVAAAASPSRRRRSTSASESDAYSFLSPASAASPSSAPSVSFNPGSLFGPSSTTPTGDSAKPADAGLGSIFGPPSSSTSSSSSSTSSASARGGSKPPLFREASSVSIFNDVPGKRTPLTKPSAARDPSLESQRGQLMASSGSAFVNRSASPSPSRPSPSSSSSSSSSFNPGSLFGPPSTSSSSSSASAPGDIFSFSVTPSSGSSTIFDPTASSTSFEFPTEYRSGGGGGGAEDQTPGDEDEEDQYDDDQEEEQGEGEEEYDDEEEFPQPEEEESHNIVWYPPESTVPLEERVKSRPLNRQAGSQPQQYSTGDDGGGRGGRQQQRGGRGGGQGRGQGQGSWRGGGRGQPRGGASSRGGAPASGGGGQARGGGGSSGGGGRERRPRTDARTERGGGARGGSRGRGGGRGGRGGGRGQGEGGGRGRATASEACPW